MVDFGLGTRRSRMWRAEASVPRRMVCGERGWRCVGESVLELLESAFGGVCGGMKGLYLCNGTLIFALTLPSSALAILTIPSVPAENNSSPSRL